MGLLRDASHQRSCGFLSVLRLYSESNKPSLEGLKQTRDTMAEGFRAITSHKWETEAWRGPGTHLKSHSQPVALLEPTLSY